MADANLQTDLPDPQLERLLEESSRAETAAWRYYLETDPAMKRRMDRRDIPADYPILKPFREVDCAGS